MWTSALAAMLLPLLATSSPVPVPNPEPATAAAFVDFPVNVIMTAGAAQIGMWVNRDGIWRSTGTITCLNAGANSYGACINVSVDRIGVVAGNGPCTVIGNNGFRATLQGKAGEGLVPIAPPQTITWVSCGP